MAVKLSTWELRYSKKVQQLMDAEQVKALAESEIDKIERMQRGCATHQSRKRGVQIDPETEQTTPFEIWITTEPEAKKIFFATKEEMEAIVFRLN